MSLNKTQLNKLNKEELVKLASSLQEERDQTLKSISSKLEKALAQISVLNVTIAELKEKNNELESTLKVSTMVSSNLENRLINIERDIHLQEQYSRRECLEIVGIPAEIADKDLESKVCDVMKEIGVDLSGSDIQACHRLRKKDRTIIKFTNRKKCIKILKNRTKLKGFNRGLHNFPATTKIYVNESLCPYYRGLWGRCKSLLIDKKIYSFWTFNGILKLKINENDEAIQITHDVDLCELFSD